MESGKFDSTIAHRIIYLAIGLVPLPIVYKSLARVERKARTELDYLLNLKKQVEGKEA
jgi:hypothetical protein